MNSHLLSMTRALFALVCVSAFALTMVATPSAAAQISDYQVVRRPVVDAKGKVLLAVRSFRLQGDTRLLVVDPISFATYDVPAASLHAADATAAANLKKTPFLKALEAATSAPFPLQNDGAQRAMRDVDGVFLTVDLCPSKRPFEREIFDTAETLGKGSPVPIAVAISGLWLASHPEELSYLKRESAAGKLSITWVNHSEHHPYDPKTPLAGNFLLAPGTDFDAEVLDVERQLLEAGVVPSPFFRFPGLVSDRRTVERLRELSLIPIGSDAWLAKGEVPRSGSFILVHGNGNEHKGVKLLLPLLRNGTMRLLPLPAAFSH